MTTGAGEKGEEEAAGSDDERKGAAAAEADAAPATPAPAPAPARPSNREQTTLYRLLLMSAKSLLV